MDYSLLESSQRLRADAARVIDHLEGGGCLEDDYVVRKVRRVNEGCMSMNANVGAQALRWLDAGKTVGLVGGDHSTPYGLIRALGARHAAFGILHVDAHCDLRDAYEGFEFSHASIMFNVLRDVPQVTKIFLKLREMGVDVPADVYTIPYAVKMILAAKARRDAGETLVLPRDEDQKGGAAEC